MFPSCFFIIKSNIISLCKGLNEIYNLISKTIRGGYDMSSELRFHEEQFDDSIKISISGEVDIYTSQKLKEKLYSIVDSTDRDLRIDCKELNYIDSTGLGIFVGTLKKAKQNGNKIYISSLKDNIKKLFIITGLDKVFIIE